MSYGQSFQEETERNNARDSEQRFKNGIGIAPRIEQARDSL